MSDLSRSGGRVVPMRLKERFLVVVRGRERLDDWVELEEAFEQTEAFFGLGAEAVTIEQHPGWRAMPDLGQSVPRRWWLKSGSVPFATAGDPSIPDGEVVEVVEAAAYDRFREALERIRRDPMFVGTTPALIAREALSE